MAHGENAARKALRLKEFWSPRYGRGGVPRGRVTKTLTHRKERRLSRRLIEEELRYYFTDAVLN